MGFDCDLKEIFTFIYQARLENSLSENEYDHVFIGEFNGVPIPDLEEASNWKWIDLEELERDIQINPDIYTYWLKVSLHQVISYLGHSEDQNRSRR